MTPSTTRPADAYRPPGRWHCAVCGQRGRGGQAAFYEHYNEHLDEDEPDDDLTRPLVDVDTKGRV